MLVLVPEIMHGAALETFLHQYKLKHSPYDLNCAGANKTQQNKK